MTYSPLLPRYPTIDPAESGGSRGFIAGLDISVKWTPTFFNLSQKAASGASLDIGLSPYPIHEFELTYNVLWDQANYDPSFRRLLAFYMVANGSRGRFTYHNPDDCLVSAQPLGVGDGATTTFVLVRTIGDPDLAFAGASFTEPIGAIDTLPGPTHIFLNGVNQTTGFTVNFVYGATSVTFATPPGAGVAVSADIGYAYYCQFAEDSLQFAKLVSGRWQSMSVKLRSCRAGA